MCDCGERNEGKEEGRRVRERTKGWGGLTSVNTYGWHVFEGGSEGGRERGACV